MKAKVFDTRLFKRILQYTKPYQWRFNGVVIFAVSLSVFAALRPYLLKQTVAFLLHFQFLIVLLRIDL